MKKPLLYLLSAFALSSACGNAFAATDPLDQTLEAKPTPKSELNRGYKAASLCDTRGRMDAGRDSDCYFAKLDENEASTNPGKEYFVTGLALHAALKFNISYSVLEVGKPWADQKPLFGKFAKGQLDLYDKYLKKTGLTDETVAKALVSDPSKADGFLQAIREARAAITAIPE